MMSIEMKQEIIDKHKRGVHDSSNAEEWVRCLSIVVAHSQAREEQNLGPLKATTSIPRSFMYGYHASNTRTAVAFFEFPFEVAPPPEEDYSLSQQPSQLPPTQVSIVNFVGCMHFQSSPVKLFVCPQVWSKAPQSWQTPKTCHAAMGHQQVCRKPWGQRLSHAPQSHQQVHGHYTPGHSLTQGHQTEGHFYHQDQLCTADEQEEQARNHQTYQKGLGAHGHQVHPGQVMQHQATPDHQIYTGASQNHQVHQAVNHTTQGHQVQLTSASCLSSSGRETSASGNQQGNTSDSGMLRPVAEIRILFTEFSITFFLTLWSAAQYRSLFSQFPFFNIVQSTVFPDVFESDRSVVVSAPTGSGKTVVMELALVRLLITRDRNHPSDPPPQPARVVYSEY
ncbi:putative ATP-dependent DNA helicase HFM1 [Portunus trituberculatus]|uniref:Putative ATP-dependent DNA helicase HFM1 n=1 Tax=Portunus trituberculatus TaxID=210409 RepID=A0A5B7DA36_PORTR|nr:putative ATP-dependent DNA helicase HFM1 [Portunus trituberculatus]